ncbi:uncharacterized protein BKA78DRAFT_173091 [Phyllosticta capitalensis]|uniref:uncharacterized protein n=1 Tax=Phyllosticta capitalensis TaxID=121624 RepID=UPI00312EB66C
MARLVIRVPRIDLILYIKILSLDSRHLLVIHRSPACPKHDVIRERRIMPCCHQYHHHCARRIDGTRRLQRSGPKGGLPRWPSKSFHPCCDNNADASRSESYTSESSKLDFYTTDTQISLESCSSQIESPLDAHGTSCHLVRYFYALVAHPWSNGLPTACNRLLLTFGLSC